MKSFAVAAAAAMSFAVFAAPAMADEKADSLKTLTEMCQKAEPDNKTCECEAKAIVDNAAEDELKIIMAFLAAQAASEGKTPEESNKIVEEELKKAGVTMEQAMETMEKAGEKFGPAMEACKAG